MGRAYAARANRAGIGETRQAIVFETRRVLVPAAWRDAILAQVDSLFENASFESEPRLIEKDDVRSTPHCMGEEAAGLAGHDDFENFRVRSQLANKLLL